MSATIPNCVSYDPTFAHELAVIIQHGISRMVEKQENVFYYLSVMNENYAQPGLKPGTEAGILKGIYKLQEGDAKLKTRVQLLGSGTILRESLAAQALLEKDWSIAADVWSVTSYTELARDGYDAERWNLLHPTDKNQKVPYVTAQLESSTGPIISSTDYMRLFSDQIRPYMPKGRTYKVLGTDGFGRSDFRYKLRNHFEVDRYFIVLAALKSLADDKQIDLAKVSEAIKKYGINADKQNPISA
jgi:pyruvate dehydrogenase E1 component